MMDSPDSFFLEFSIRDIVKKNQYWAAQFPEGPTGGIGGVVRGIGGGLGAAAGRIGAGPAGMRSRHESFTFAINAASGKEFDEGKFMSSLRAGVQAEITASGLAITSGDIFGSAGFSLDYSAGELDGRIHIIGRKALDNSRYHITASLEEKGPTASMQPWLRRNKPHPPEGNYYVVTFPDDDIRAYSQRFYYRGKEALDSSRDRIRRLSMKDPSKSSSMLKSLANAEVYVWRPVDPETRERLGGIAPQFEVPAEYDQHSVVYFLNETALRMYREAGEEFEVLKIVSEDEMATIPGPQLRGPYLPDES